MEIPGYCDDAPPIKLDNSSASFAQWLISHGSPNPTIDLTIEQAMGAFLATDDHYAWLTKRCVETCNEGALAYIKVLGKIWAAKITPNWTIVVVQPSLDPPPRTSMMVLPVDELKERRPELYEYLHSRDRYVLSVAKYPDLLRVPNVGANLVPSSMIPYRRSAASSSSSSASKKKKKKKKRKKPPPPSPDK